MGEKFISFMAFMVRMATARCDPTKSRSGFLALGLLQHGVVVLKFQREKLEMDKLETGGGHIFLETLARQGGEGDVGPHNGGAFGFGILAEKHIGRALDLIGGLAQGGEIIFEPPCQKACWSWRPPLIMG